jgi:hypothetical protein
VSGVQLFVTDSTTAVGEVEEGIVWALDRWGCRQRELGRIESDRTVWATDGLAGRQVGRTDAAGAVWRGDWRLSDKQVGFVDQAGTVWTHDGVRLGREAGHAEPPDVAAGAALLLLVAIQDGGRDTALTLAGAGLVVGAALLSPAEHHTQRLLKAVRHFNDEELLLDRAEAHVNDGDGDAAAEMLTQVLQSLDVKPAPTL